MIKPQREKQVHDEVSSVMLLRQGSRQCLPKLSCDLTDVSLLCSYLPDKDANYFTDFDSVVYLYLCVFLFYDFCTAQV